MDRPKCESRVSDSKYGRGPCELSSIFSSFFFSQVNTRIQIVLLSLLSDLARLEFSLPFSERVRKERRKKGKVGGRKQGRKEDERKERRNEER